MPSLKNLAQSTAADFVLRVLRLVSAPALTFIMLTKLISGADALSPPDPVSFVKGVAQEAIGVLNNKGLADQARKTSFRTVILKNFDAPAVGQFVLGSYWAKATPEQQAKFQDVFKEALAQIYIERFFDYDGQSLQVIGSKAGEAGVTVVQTTVGTPTGGTVYNVDWLVLGSGDHLNLIDVVIDGVSTMSTTKQDYASVLRSTNGNLDGLTSRLAEKVH